ncbi:MAG TPA: beta-ketoacyl-ACP synthase III [Kofleriaceae bacterium]|nr:beta-ketoacyl-ACP synthase III [Kofleriaceae bacterium]
MSSTAITGSGLFAPEAVIDNAELCVAFNTYVRAENERNAAAIAAGEMEPLRESSAEFIEKASGIRVRHVQDRTGILDPERMCPNIPDRPDDELSVQAEYAVNAARDALAAAELEGKDIDLIILAGSNLQRLYPAISIEVQSAIGAGGFAFDLTVGCSSATFPIQIASDAIRSGSATRALLLNPELMSPQVNYRDRDSHFIFGDAGTAIIVEATANRRSKVAFEILGTRLHSRFSSNIRNNGGYVNRCDPDRRFADDKLFYQQGRRVFKDIVPLASDFILDHIRSLRIDPERVSRYWLHQANINMNQLIAKRLLGRPATLKEAPIIIDEYANTASAGSIIAFHLHHADLLPGEVGCICSFGAGYSIGSVIIRRL